MKEITARDAKNRFDYLLDVVQSAPVRVTKKGRAVGVMMSVQHYERLHGAAWERLTMTMDALGKEASAPVGRLALPISPSRLQPKATA